MLSPVASPVAALAGQPADLVLGAAILALIGGGLLCLAAQEGGEPAAHLLGLALGSGMALGLAQTLAALLLPLLARA